MGSARADETPGAQARSPREVPRRGWFQIAKRAWRQAKADRIPLFAAGVAFYAFLSIFPALIAGVTLYGLLADPEQAIQQVERVAEALPEAARELLVQQVEQLTATQPSGLGVAAVVSILVALWSASNGVNNLVIALNVAYGEQDTRGFVKRRALSLLLTLGAIVIMVVMIGLIVVIPVLLEALGLDAVVRTVIQVARWGLLVVMIVLSLGLLYWFAPNRQDARLRWVSVGAVVATVLWVLASVGFSLYVSLGGYGNSYGSLAGVVILLFWLWISSYAILLGAEVNAQAERQTARDTTTGRERPPGQREAVAADAVPPASRTSGQA